MLIRARLLLYLFFTLPATLTAQVSAGFSIVIPSSNCNPAVYSFINTSVGMGLTYGWNFGVYPGVNSIFENPRTTYLGCGSFTVKLVVTDGNGVADSSAQTVNIRCSPKANFESTFTTGCLPLTTNFISTALPGSGSLNSYVWDFGDGSTGDGDNPAHTYLVSGCKNVTLIVTNSYGCISDTTLSNLLCVYQPPVGNFTSSLQSACAAPFTTTYQANPVGGTPPYTYRWLFSGGSPSTSTLNNPSITYNSPGSFNTTLVTTDAHGCSDTVTKRNYIAVANNTCDFTIGNDLHCAPASIDVNGISSLNQIAWQWQVSSPGSAISPSAQNTSVSLPDSGSYNVCLNVTYAGGCMAEKCSTIVVIAPPVAHFGTSGNLSTCQIPDVIDYIDSSSGTNLTYQWAFAGGVPASSNLQQPLLVSYNTCGNYNASVTVTDANGCSATYAKNNFLHLACNRAIYTVSPSNGCLPLTAAFNSNGSTGDPVSYLWDFNDPNSGTADTSTLPNPIHTFNDAGCYTIRLTTTTAQGCVYTYSLESGVCAGFKPHANFSANPPVNCANKPILFNDSSTNTYSYTAYAWDFHNTPPIIVESTQQNPSYTYYDVGTYDITLIVSNYGCGDTITKDNLVQTIYPLAVPVVIKNCGNPLSVTLNGALSEGAQTYKWIILGGGVPDSALTQNVIVNFPMPGAYNASLFVSNDSTGCSDLENVVVNIVNAGPQFTGSPLAGCSPLTSCMATVAPGVIHYQWTVTNQAGSIDTTTTTGSPCFHFAQPGNYNVQLITADTFGCIDTIYKADYISVSHALANFVAAPLFGCAPVATNFLDSSISTAGIEKWAWNFGDNASGVADTSQFQNPRHIFNRAGNYSISLSIVDSNGCVSDSLRINYVIADKPYTPFTVVNQPDCYGTIACFTTDSINTKYNYRWNFGDGATADTANTCHLYTNLGMFAVTLVATDSAGCTDSVTAVDTARVSSVHPGFTADDTTTTCPPLSVQFTNLTTSADSVTGWFWTFGDGQVSALQNPFHIYTVSGLFTVTLVAYNINGCIDTIIDTNYIRITGPSANVSVPPTSGCVPHSTCMSAESFSAITYTWNFGDGTVLPGNDSVCYTYTRTGTFFPELILSDRGGCIFALPMGTVNVIGTVAAFAVDTPVFCNRGNVMFTDSSYGTSAAQSYSWNFDDVISGTLNTSTFQNASHFFATPGTYYVTLGIVSVDGCIDSIGHTVIVNPPPAVSMTISDTSGCAPANIFFTGQSTSVTPITSVVWNFGDSASGGANISMLLNPGHSYGDPGIYHVTFTATDSNTCAASAVGIVNVHPTPIAAFTAFDTCLNTQPVIFTNNSQIATGYLWSFGDGNYSSMFSPAHAYADSGFFTTQLIAQTDFCSDTVKAQVQIFGVPVAGFGVSVGTTCGTPALFSVLNHSTGASSYFWNFGNDSVSTLLNPRITFLTTGTFNIVLLAINSHGCKDTARQPVIVYPKPSIQHLEINPAEGCQPLHVSFGVEAANTGTYSWNFGTGDVSNVSTFANASYTYADTGTYTISVYLTSANLCTDTLILPDTVRVYVLPVADFEPIINSSGYPYNGTVVFLNQSKNAATYFWNFGDGATSTEPDPQHRYETIDSFSTLLLASTPYGCIDSIVKTFFVIKKSLYVPNALQPDFVGGQQLIKVWKPVGVGLLTYQARVYDKWGELLWESDSITNYQPAEAWDGTYQGKPCQQDVYIWKVNATFLDGTVWPGMNYSADEGGGEKTIGSITLIR